MKFVAYAPHRLHLGAHRRRRWRRCWSWRCSSGDQFRFRAAHAPAQPAARADGGLRTPRPSWAGKPLRLYYIAQVTTAPPTFALTCNKPSDVPDRYKRYIINQLRKTFDLRVPIRLHFRERPGKAKREARRRPRQGSLAEVRARARGTVEALTPLGRGP